MGFCPDQGVDEAGYRIFLNGHEIHTYVWWKDTPFYCPIMLGPNRPNI